MNTFEVKPFAKVFKNIFNEFIGMTLVNKTMRVSSVEYYNHHLHTLSNARSPPKVKCLSATIYPLFIIFHLLHAPFPSGNHHTIVCVYFFVLDPFTFSTQPPNTLPSESCQSALYESASHFVSYCCSLDSTNK